MQVAQPRGSGGHICRMGDFLTGSIKAQLQVSSILLEYRFVENVFRNLQMRQMYVWSTYIC